MQPSLYFQEDPASTIIHALEGKPHKSTVLPKRKKKLQKALTDFSSCLGKTCCTSLQCLSDFTTSEVKLNRSVYFERPPHSFRQRNPTGILVFRVWFWVNPSADRPYRKKEERENLLWSWLLFCERGEPKEGSGGFLSHRRGRYFDFRVLCKGDDGFMHSCSVCMRAAAKLFGVGAEALDKMIQNLNKEPLSAATRQVIRQSHAKRKTKREDCYILLSVLLPLISVPWPGHDWTWIDVSPDRVSLRKSIYQLKEFHDLANFETIPSESTFNRVWNDFFLSVRF